MSLREDVLSRISTKLHGPHSIGTWGNCWLKPLSFGEAVKIATSDETGQRLLPIVYSLCDENGKPHFQEGDLEKLAKLPPSEIRAVVADLEPLLKSINESDESLEKKLAD